MKLREARAARLLCFDIENKPGTYGGMDYTHGKVTALGAQFLDEEEATGWVIRRSQAAQPARAAKQFRVMWEQADVVLGHNIRGHDIKLLNGFYTSLDLPLLPERRTIDTYRDQPKIRGLSRSLENLCDRWGCPEKKLGLSEYDWEQAYDGVPWAVEKMLARVTSDVRINIWLYHELRRRELLP